MAKTFTPLVVTTKFFNYSMPLNLDTYRYCSFQCEYCFMKNRIIGKRDESLDPNIGWLEHKFQKVYDDKNVNKTNFLEMLLKNRITLNGGTKSEAFQPQEKEVQNTKQIVDICNQYDQQIVFTTKSDTYYDVNVTPRNHSFWLSVTNHYTDRYLEPNVPAFENRVNFYRQLKDEGFKVGIRFEPFIPNITDVEKCLSYFDDVDCVHISRLRLLPQLDNNQLLDYCKCSKREFKTHGLTSLKAETWYNYVKDTLEFLEDNGYQYSTSFINCGNSDLGELAWNTTNFDTFHLKQKYGDEWTLNEGLTEIGEYKDCMCSSLFTSNRRNGCRTVEDFYIRGWHNTKSKIHPNNQFKPPKTLFDFKEGNNEE